MIDDLTDDEIRNLLTATGDRPTSPFRNELRDLLTDEATDGPTNIAVTRRLRAESGGARRWWVPASVAAAAVLVVVGGLFALGRSGGDTTPADTHDDSAPTTTHDVNTTLASLVGIQLVELDAPGDRLPTLTITDFSTIGSAGADLIVEAFDGCNSYTATIRIVGDEIRETANDWQTDDPCPIAALPISAPDVITPLADGISIRTHDDDAEHVFRPFYAIALASDGFQIYGTWSFQGTTAMTISADTIVIGGCELSWRFGPGGRIVPVTDDGADLPASDQSEACSPGSEIPDLLGQALTGRSHEMRRRGSSLFVQVYTDTDDQEPDPVFRLELDADVGAPGQVPDDLFGRTWVMWDFPSSRLPWMRFNSLSSVQGGVGVDSFDGCNGGSGTFELDAHVVVNSSVGTSYVLCEGIRATPIADGTVLSLELDQPRDILTVTTGDASTRYVALESFDLIDAASDVVGDWSHGGEHVMTLFADGESMELGSTEIKIGSCDAGWQIESGVRLIIDVEDRPTPCRIDPLVLDPLVQGLAVGNNEVYRTGPDTLTVVIAGRDVYRLNATVETVVASTGDPELDAFLEDAAGSTWVLLTAADEDVFQIDRPHLTIGDHRTGALALEGYSGCTSVNSESAWEHGPDGFTVAVTARACRGQIPLDLADFNIVDDRLVVTGPDGESVSLDRLEAIAGPASIEGRWQTSDIADSELVIDLRDFRVRLAGCTTTFKVGTSVGSLVTTGWESNAADCTGDELSLSRALVESTITAHVTPTGDHLVLQASSARHRPIVFALPYLGPVVDPNGISFEDGSAFGYRQGDFVTADEALDHVSSLLGPPTHDTGWFDTTPDPTITDHEDCMGDRTIRTLWWHDFSLSFFEFQGVEQLWTWTVGDTRITRNGDRREPYLPDLADRFGLTSDSDIPIGIGSTTADLIDAYGNQARSLNTPPDLFDDGAVFWAVGDTGFQVLVRDDIVIGFGDQILFC